MGIKNIFNNFFKKNDKEEENILEKYAQNSEDDVIKNDDIINDIKEEAIESENDIDEIKEEIIENINNINDFMEPFGEVLSEKKEELLNNVEEPIEELLVEKKGLFARLKEGLKKTSDSFSSKFDNLFKGYLKIDDELYEELEEILITSDISFDTTLKIVENLKENII